MGYVYSSATALPPGPAAMSSPAARSPPSPAVNTQPSVVVAHTNGHDLPLQQLGEKTFFYDLLNWLSDVEIVKYTMTLWCWYSLPVTSKITSWFQSYLQPFYDLVITYFVHVLTLLTIFRLNFDETTYVIFNVYNINWVLLSQVW